MSNQENNAIINRYQFSVFAYIFAVMFFALCLSSCNKLEEGDVIEKWYEPTRTYATVMPILISNGKTTSTIMVPHMVTDYEDWVIKIRGKYNGEDRIETIYVGQKQYECLSVGSHLKLSEDCSTHDDNNQKVRQ
jgi:hypothetical protein